MTRKYLQELIKTLQEFYKCPACDTNYFFDDIKFLAQIDQSCYAQLTCHECTMSVVATVTVGGAQPLDPQTMQEAQAKLRERVAKSEQPGSDLTGRERTKFTKRGAITASEVAGFHSFISKYRGGLKKLTK